MRWLPDATLDHLRSSAGEPEPAGRYRLLEPVGKGGMGTVYRAHDLELDREVALKVTHLQVADTEGTARLEREARILARLEHPGIVPVHDLGTLEDGRLFYVMKLVRGQRLDQHVAAVDSLAERLRLFVRICEPVAFAHAHGVLHRDLKPQNVMVGAFGEVLVMDWGVARLEAESPLSRPLAEDQPRPAEGETAAGTILGTPGYMAPEQASGLRVDERTDVYSLGALLRFLLLEGGQPPRQLKAIVEKASSSAPAERYPSVSTLAADVARFLDGLAVEAYREGLLEKTWRVVKKYRTPIVLVLAYLAMRLLLFFFARV